MCQGCGECRGYGVCQGCVVCQGCGVCQVGMGNISILSYIVILRAHDNHIVVVLQLSSYHLYLISGAFT